MYQGIDFMSLDEMRSGLKTDLGKLITTRGVKPIGLHHHVFEYQYIAGAISLKTGQKVMMEQDACNGIFFEGLLKNISERNPNELIFILLDNGKFHKKKDIEIPKNIRLIFLPPYSPELNPIERFWLEIRRVTKNKVFDTTELMMETIRDFVLNVSTEFCRSVVGFKFYNDALKLINCRIK